MHSFAVRLTSGGEAEDIVQETLLAAWRLRERVSNRRKGPRALGC
ncbi:sigma factor [Jatrophihabitans sp. GAS493]